MLYEIEDIRQKISEIRERYVIRMFEYKEMNGGVMNGEGVGVVEKKMWDKEKQYLRENEFD